MDDKKKKYSMPEAEVVSFVDLDIITVSKGDGDPGYEDEDWEG